MFRLIHLNKEYCIFNNHSFHKKKKTGMFNVIWPLARSNINLRACKSRFTKMLENYKKKLHTLPSSNECL